MYDPFAGSGTTGIEAALLNRIPILNDINPISRNISEPRLSIPKIELIKKRLEKIFSNTKIKNFKPKLEMFFHFDIEKELCILKKHFKKELAPIDKWIRFVATTRLTGHSKVTFRVYTLLPNQVTSKKRQIKINKKLKQTPEYRNVVEIILKKTKQLLRKLTFEKIKQLNSIGTASLFLGTGIGEIKHY